MVGGAGDALGGDVAEVRIASPFIKDGAVEKLLSGTSTSLRFSRGSTSTIFATGFPTLLPCGD
jgi:hypothetical protein